MNNITIYKNKNNSEIGITEKLNSVNRNSAVYSEEIKDIRSLWTEKDIEAFNKLSKKECEVYVKAINNVYSIIDTEGGIKKLKDYKKLLK